MYNVDYSKLKEHIESFGRQVSLEEVLLGTSYSYHNVKIALEKFPELCNIVTKGSLKGKQYYHKGEETKRFKEGLSTGRLGQRCVKHLPVDW